MHPAGRPPTAASSRSGGTDQIVISTHLASCCLGGSSSCPYRCPCRCRRSRRGCRRSWPSIGCLLGSDSNDGLASSVCRWSEQGRPRSLRKAVCSSSMLRLEPESPIGELAALLSSPLHPLGWIASSTLASEALSLVVHSRLRTTDLP